MYLEHFGLQEIPFRITPQIEHFYAGAQRGALLDALVFAVTHDEGIMIVTGEVGVGKTMLCRMLIERLPQEVLMIYVGNPSLSPRELIETIALELGVHVSDGSSLLRLVERRLIELYAEGRRVVAVIDEAHAMPLESLEQVRLLSNLETATRKLLQIVLFGQPEFESLLSTRGMRSLRERVTQHFRLQPLTRREVGEYLEFRLRAAGYKGPSLFGGSAVRLITRASRGLVRRVNILADKTLMAAFAANTHSISTHHVKTAFLDSSFGRSANRRVWIAGMGAAALAALSAAVGTGWLWETKIHESGTAPTMAPITRPPIEHAATGEALPPQPIDSDPIANASTPLPAATDPSRYAPIPEELGPLARKMLTRSREETANIPDDHWFLQLRSIQPNSASTLEAFIVAAGRVIEAQSLRLYVARNDPKRHVGVIYGDFATLQQAQAALGSLPAWIRSSGAFPRRYKSLR